MSLNETNTFSFLENIVPVAALNAKKMEELIFEDASSAIMKARIFVEEILSEVFKQEKVEEYHLSTLFDKISYLSREGYIQREIQRSFDTIRFTGNKAAHDGNFDDLAEALKLHKEVYKIAVWFFEVYSADHVKIPPYQQPKPRQIEDIVNQQILALLGAGAFNHGQSNDQSTSLEENGSVIVKEKAMDILIKDLPDHESYLVRELNRLKDSSQEAIENASQFSTFKDYLHVEREIQKDLEEILKGKSQQQGNLILLCGSVGDGKSHLLAYLKEKKPELISHYKIFNDATESFSPHKNAMETLEEILQDFSDQKIDSSTDQVILAINMGVLHNFIHTNHKEFTYSRLKQFVEQSNLFSQNVTTRYSEDFFDLLSFADYHSFELTEDGPTSSFYSGLMEKVCNESNQNPFYLALLEDEKRNMNTIVHQNFKLLQNKVVQNQVVDLIIQTIVKQKLVISARAFLNFITDIIIPDEIQSVTLMNEFDILGNSLPTLLFNRRERSAILNAISQLDPIHRRSVYIDQLVVDFNTLNDWSSLVEENLHDEISKRWIMPFVNKSDLTNYSFDFFFEQFVRNIFLTNQKFAEHIADESYLDYMKNVYYFNVLNRKKVVAFYNDIESAIFKWKGTPKKDYIYLSRPSDKYYLAQKLDLQPTIAHLKVSTYEILYSFKSTITIAYHGGNDEHKVFLEIDYPLYSLLKKVLEGYRPNKKDEEDAINFVEFIEKLMAFGEKKKEMLVYFSKDQRFYKIKRDGFGAFAFEKE